MHRILLAALLFTACVDEVPDEVAAAVAPAPAAKESAAPADRPAPESWVFLDRIPYLGKVPDSNPLVLSLSPVIDDGGVAKRVISIVAFDRFTRQPVVHFGAALPWGSNEILQFGRDPSYEIAPITAQWGTVRSADDIAIDVLQ